MGKRRGVEFETRIKTRTRRVVLRGYCRSGVRVRRPCVDYARRSVLSWWRGCPTSGRIRRCGTLVNPRVFTPSFQPLDAFRRLVRKTWRSITEHLSGRARHATRSTQLVCWILIKNSSSSHSRSRARLNLISKLQGTNKVTLECQGALRRATLHTARLPLFPSSCVGRRSLGPPG